MAPPKDTSRAGTPDNPQEKSPQKTGGCPSLSDIFSHPESLVGYIDSMPFYLVVISPDHMVISVNASLREALGYDENEIAGRDFVTSLVHEKDHPLFPAYLSSLTADRDRVYEESAVVTKAGKRIHVTWHGRLLKGPGHDIARYSLIGIDVTKQRRERKQRQLEKSSYVRLFENAPEAIVLCDNQGILLRVNKEFTDMFGYQPEDALGRNVDALIAPPDMRDEASSYTTRVISGEKLAFETVRMRNDETRIHVSILAIPVYDDSGQSAVYCIYRDITDRKKMEEALRERERMYHELSITDGLTALYNSRYFYQQIESEVMRTNRYGHPLTMLMIDVDDFKDYNDRFGHLDGDNVLRTLGSIIKQNIRDTDSGYRYGGEEFAVILPDTNAQQSVPVAERIRKTFKGVPFTPRPGKTVTVTISIGVSQFMAGEGLKDFIKRADKNLYHCKKEGKNCIYSGETESAS